MNNALEIAEQFLVDRIIGSKFPVTGESKIKFSLIAFSGLAGLLGLGFLFYAAYLWLSANYSLIVAMAVMGVISLSVSAIGAVVVISIMAYQHHKMKMIREEFIELAEQAFLNFEEEISVPVNDNPKTAVLISSVVGYLAGERFL